MNFMEKLSKIVDRNNSLLCVGLDIDKEKIPNIKFKESKEFLYPRNFANL